jgi:micrococcal nuclease
MLLLVIFMLSACTVAQVFPAPTLDPTTAGDSSCIPNRASGEVGFVYEVIDGDTFRVDIDGQYYKVRLIGIDSPEYYEDHYNDATILLDKLIYGKDVELFIDTNNTDQYDRLLRYVLVDGLFVNYEMVSNGYAVNKDYRPDTACSASLSKAHSFAVTNGLGMYE